MIVSSDLPLLESTCDHSICCFPHCASNNYGPITNPQQFTQCQKINLRKAGGLKNPTLGTYFKGWISIWYEIHKEPHHYQLCSCNQKDIGLPLQMLTLISALLIVLSNPHTHTLQWYCKENMYWLMVNLSTLFQRENMRPYSMLLKVSFEFEPLLTITGCHQPWFSLRFVMTEVFSALTPIFMLTSLAVL